MEYEIAICDKCGERRPHYSEYRTDTWERAHKQSCPGKITIKKVLIRDEKKRKTNPVFIGKLLTALRDDGTRAVKINWKPDSTAITRPDNTRLGFKYLRQSAGEINSAEDATEEVNEDEVAFSLLSRRQPLTSMNTIILNYRDDLEYTSRANSSRITEPTILAPLKGNTFALAYRYDGKTYMTAMSGERETNFYKRLEYVDNPAMVAVQEMGLPPEAAGLLSAFYLAEAFVVTKRILANSFELMPPSAQTENSFPRLTNGVITLLAPSIQAQGQTVTERFALMEISGEDRDVILAKDKKSLVWKSVRARAKGLLL